MLCVPLSFAFRRILSTLLFLALLDFESALSDRRHIEPVLNRFVIPARRLNQKTEFDKLIADKKYLEESYTKGADAAFKISRKIVSKAYHKAGFVDRA